MLRQLVDGRLRACPLPDVRRFTPAFLLTSVLLSFVVSSSGIERFIDPRATAGLNDGTDWNNAWTNFASINWKSLRAGDTLYLSGGPADSFQAYSETFTNHASGHPGNYFSIRAGQDSGHNGQVLFLIRPQ